MILYEIYNRNGELIIQGSEMKYELYAFDMSFLNLYTIIKSHITDGHNPLIVVKIR